MAQRIITEVEIPALAEAMRLRGYWLESALTGIDAAPDPPAVAAILRKWGPGIALRLGSIPEIAVASSAAAVADALDAGAADAVAAWVDPHELAARLDARIRRHAPQPIDLADLHIDRVHRLVTRSGRPVELLPREYALLLHLAERRGRCISHRTLLAEVWGLRFDPGTNVVAVHMSKLRAKIDRGAATPLLHTVKGLGYRLDTG